MGTVLLCSTICVQSQKECGHAGTVHLCSFRLMLSAQKDRPRVFTPCKNRCPGRAEVLPDAWGYVLLQGQLSVGEPSKLNAQKDRPRVFYLSLNRCSSAGNALSLNLSRA